MTVVRNVVFDFGGVLVEWRPALILENHYPDPVRREIARREILSHPDWLELDRGTYSDEEALRRFAARTGESVEAMTGFLDAVRLSLTPKSGTVALLQALAARGVPVYGLTNMSIPTYDWLRERHAFFGLLQGVVVSAAEGLVKPEAALYTRLTTTYGLVPEHTLFIDDMAVNVAAARALGFQAEIFESADRLQEILVGHRLL
jgi:putative hydrolase of the HAD superfamily